MRSWSFARLSANDCNWHEYSFFCGWHCKKDVLLLFLSIFYTFFIRGTKRFTHCNENSIVWLIDYYHKLLFCNKHVIGVATYTHHKCTFDSIFVLNEKLLLMSRWRRDKLKSGVCKRDETLWLFFTSLWVSLHCFYYAHVRLLWEILGGLLEFLKI
jgi:hypothetical protein